MDTDNGRVGKPTGLSSPTEPEVSALTGFDPSRVTRVEKLGGTTCTHFVGGVFCSFSDPGVFRISAASQAWYFEWSDRFGPLRVGARGETREQPGWRSPFWRVTSLWSLQGKRTEEIARRTYAVWDQPPVATHYFVRHGRKRVVVRSDIPEGYLDGYSEELFVEASAGALDAEGSVVADESAARQGDAQC